MGRYACPEGGVEGKARERSALHSSLTTPPSRRTPQIPRPIKVKHVHLSLSFVFMAECQSFCVNALKWRQKRKDGRHEEGSGARILNGRALLRQL
ncbi:hypothetical protein ACFX10_035796 [Malus domestica]